MILTGDIGGTKVLLSLFEERQGSLWQVEHAVFASRKYPGLENAIDEFLSQFTVKINRACFGIAGPVCNGVCQTTNLPWVVDTQRLKTRFGIDTVDLINDLAAMASAVPFLPPEQVEVLQAGDPKASGRIGVIAAGTGLGQAFLISHENRFLVLDSEGGHCDFAPRNELETALLRHMLKKFERVSNERLLSGAGLFDIYQFIVQHHALDEPQWLKKEFQADDPPSVVSLNALRKKSPACEKALDLFVSLYGAVAGNMALQILAGIYVGGGIAPKIISKLKEDIFMEAFLAKGRFKTLLSRMPVKVIMNEKASLIGAAHYALREITP